MIGSEAGLLSLEVEIRDLRADDLPGLEWSGGPLHVKHMSEQLDRARRGTVDYLVALLRSGQSVGKAGIDYEERPGAGTIGQMAVLGPLQSCGIGAALIRTAESRIRVRGLHRSEIAVEVSNPRAQQLYERLGYVAYDQQPAAWDQQAPDGAVFRYETTCVWLGKDLAASRVR